MGKMAQCCSSKDGTEPEKKVEGAPAEPEAVADN